MVLERFDWPAERLVLELTESVLMDEVSEAAPVLLRLKESGIQIAIDDFGTGYSSLSYLHRFPVDQVKLDKSFVESISYDGEGSPIARAVINMAHALGISVTAEGVETIEQARGLRVLGCERAQGFLFGRPVRSGRVLRATAREAPLRHPRRRCDHDRRRHRGLTALRERSSPPEHARSQECGIRNSKLRAAALRSGCESAPRPTR